MQHGRDPHQRRHQMRQDTQRAGERSDDTSPRPARQPCGDGVDRAGAGRGDDDERSQQELDRHEGGSRTARRSSKPASAVEIKSSRSEPRQPAAG